MIAVLHSEEQILTDVQSALDFIITAKYETGCSQIVLNKEAIVEDFFVLSTRLAGDILQKFINDQVKFSIYGTSRNIPAGHSRILSMRATKAKISFLLWMLIMPLRHMLPNGVNSNILK